MFTENVSAALQRAGYGTTTTEYSKVMAAAANMQNDVERTYNNAVLELKVAAESLADYQQADLIDLINQLSDSISILSAEHASIAESLESLIGSNGSITTKVEAVEAAVQKNGTLEKTLGAALTEVSTSLGLSLSGKVDSVKASVETSASTIGSKMDGMKTSFETSSSSLGAKIDGVKASVETSASTVMSKVESEHSSTKTKIHSEAELTREKVTSESASNNKTKQILDKIAASETSVLTEVGKLEGNLTTAITNSTESVAVSAARRAHDEYLNQQNAWISMLKFNIDDWMRTATQIASDQAVLNYATNKFTTAVTTLDKFFGLLSDLEIQAHSWWEVVDSLSDTKVYMSKVMDENKNMVALVRDMIKQNATRENIKVATEVANTTIQAAAYADAHKNSRRWG